MENVKENYGRNESEILGSYMNSCEGDAQARGMADAVARRSYGKLVAFLAARAGDVAAAEDALSDAFVSALTDWPQNGCPSNPEAWLLTVARRKMIDLARRRRYSEVATERLNLLAEGLDAAATGAEIPVGWTPCWTPFTPHSRKVGQTLAGPILSAAASPRKRYFCPGSWPICCRRSRRLWGCWLSCFTRKPGVTRDATRTANTFRLPIKIRSCGTGG